MEIRKLLERIVRTIDAISYWSGYISMFLVVIFAAFMFIEVICRYGFNRPTLWATESTGLAFGVYILLSSGYVLLVRGHVSMDAIYNLLSLRKRAILDILTAFLFFLFAGVLLWKGIPGAIRAVVLGEHSQTIWGAPEWPVKIAIPLGASLILLQGLAKLVRDFYLAVTGRELVKEVAVQKIKYG